MTDAMKLPKNLKKRLFRAQEASEYGISHYKLNLMLANGLIEKLGRGIYRENTGDISNEELFSMATIWLGYPSAVCLFSALSYYNLTDEIPKKIWMMVKDNKTSRRHEIRLFRHRNPHWEIGINKTKAFWITNVARTIIDIFAHPQIVGANIATQALKQAIKEKQTTVREIYEMSLIFGINHRITPYLEMVS